MYREVNEMPKCAACGILIPCEEQVFTHHGMQLYACSTRCIRLYDAYKFPRYRADILAAEQRGEMGRRLGYAGREAAS